jgi:hypothetical protein
MRMVVFGEIGRGFMRIAFGLPAVLISNVPSKHYTVSSSTLPEQLGEVGYVLKGGIAVVTERESGQEATVYDHGPDGMTVTRPLRDGKTTKVFGPEEEVSALLGRRRPAVRFTHFIDP